MPPREKRKLYCNRCKRESNHNLRGNYYSADTDEETLFEESEDCSLYECAGCEAPTLLVEYRNSGMGDDETDISLFPERRSSWRLPKDFVKLPARLTQTYRETVSAYNNGDLLLSTIGLRALIEGVCDD